MKIVLPEEYDFAIVVEYPRGSVYVLGTGIGIYLAAEDGNPVSQITTCGAISLHADASSIVWAELEMYATKDGVPIFDGNPCIENNQVITKTFFASVTQVRSALSYKRGYVDGAKRGYLDGVTGEDQPPGLAEIEKARKKSRS